MSIHISADPYSDFDAWDAEQQEWLDSLPVCDCCGEPIQDEAYYDLGDGIYCEDCLNSQFRVINSAL